LTLLDPADSRLTRRHSPISLGARFDSVNPMDDQTPARSHRRRWLFLLNAGAIGAMLGIVSFVVLAISGNPWEHVVVLVGTVFPGSLLVWYAAGKLRENPPGPRDQHTAG
jgi:hypothetical protein